MPHEHAESERRLRHLVADAGRILDHLGLVDYLGHSSARIPGTDQLVIKPKHSPTIRGMSTLGPDDMLVADMDGAVVSGEHTPPSEIFIHTEIYRARPDVAAIVHTHQPVATVLGVLGAPLLPLLHVPSIFVPTDIPTWPCPLLVTDPPRGAQLAEALASARFCHLQGHGIVSVGTSVEEATVGAVLLEQQATVNLEALRTQQEPRQITPDEIEALRSDAAGVDGRWAYYKQLAGA